MAKVLGIEHFTETIDGSHGENVLYPVDYPVMLELIVEPEPWSEIVRRHTGRREDIGPDLLRKRAPMILLEGER